MMPGKRRSIWIQLPIDAASRALVDGENARLRHAIIPIITDKDGRPFLVGSAVAIRFRDRPCLVTALHVLTDYRDRPLFFFNAAGEARPFGGAFEIADTHDLAATLLDAGDAAALSHIPFLEEGQIGSVADAAGRFYGSVAGYPHTASRSRGKLVLETPMEIVSGIAREVAGGFVTVDFDKKAGGRDARGHVLARDQEGKSGGAIFGMRLAGHAVIPFQPAMLVGIGTHWKHGQKLIRGTRASILVELLTKLTGGEFPT